MRAANESYALKMNIIVVSMVQPQVPRYLDSVQVAAALDEAQQAQNQPVNDVAAAQAGQAPNPDNNVSAASVFLFKYYLTSCIFTFILFDTLVLALQVIWDL